MADDAPVPVTFRPKSPQARALLEAVARHRGVSLSKLAAEATDHFARLYVEKVGAEQFSADLRSIHDREQRVSERMLQDILNDPGVDGTSPSDDDVLPMRTQ
jgi:hypothetical protein